MKKVLSILAIAFIAFGCGKIQEENLETAKSYTVTASLDGTRVYIQDNGDSFSHLWKTGDHISVINSDALTTANDYALSTGDGLASGSFTGSVAPTSTFYAVYPHRASNQVTDGKFAVIYPANQVYVADSYDPAANVYVAEGSGTNMVFINTTAYLELSLYSTDDDTEVTKIELSTIGGEKIAGAGQVTVTAGVASVTMDGGAESTITLTPATPVTIASGSDSTRFFFAVPAIVYDGSFKGYQIKVYNGTGAMETYQWRNIGSAFTPNHVRQMPRLLYDPQSKGSTATLLAGASFCRALKKLAEPENAAAIDDDINTPCPSITKVIFEANKNLTGISGVDVSAAKDGSIIASINAGVVRVQTSAEQIVANANCSSMFRYMTNLAEIRNLDSVDFSSVTNMAYFFYDTAVTDVDLSGLDLGNVINTRMTFYQCYSLESVDFGTNTFASDTSLADLFYDCGALESVDLSNFDTRNVINSRYMFYRCSTLTDITFGSKCTFEKDTAFSYMFRGCSSLTSLDLSMFNSAAVSSTRYMFAGCTNLGSITFGSESTFEKCVQYGYMFSDCTALTSLALTMFKTTNAVTSNRSCVAMFMNCTNLATVSFKTDNSYAFRYVTNTNSMFKNCSSLTSLDLRGLRRGNATNGSSSMFEGCSNLETLILGTNYSKASTTASMFEGCAKLTSVKTLNTSGTETTQTLSNTTDMSRMFYGCESLTAIPACFTLSSSLVTSVKEMFANCNFTSLDCSAFNSEALLDADGFVDGCDNLTSLTFGASFTGASLTSTAFMAADPSTALTITCKTALKTKLTTLQPALNGYSNLSWTTSD